MYAILGELRKQGKTISSMNTAVQVIGIIMILSIIGSCLLVFLGPGLVF